MNFEETTLKKLAAQLVREQSVAFRMAVEKRQNAWRFHTIILEVFPRQPGEETPTIIYEYEHAAFLAGVISGAEAAAWLKTGEILVSEEGPHPRSYVVHIPALHQQITCSRHSRNALYDYVRVPWPYTRYELSWSGRDPSARQSEFLVSDKHPFFPDFGTALYSLVYRGTYWDQSTRPSPGEKFIIRMAPDEAWLENIHISPTALTITVGGAKRKGTFLEISGFSALPSKQRIWSKDTITYPLTTGLPQEWWVVLSRGSHWLDFYQHVARWPSLYGVPPHVTTDPPDRAVQVQEWVARGEGQNIEYKIDATHSERFLQSVAAFANGEGGVIIIGVPNDNPSIVGYPGDLDEAERRLTSSIRSNLTEMPPVKIERCTVEGVVVLLVLVDPGEMPPYGVKSKHPSSSPAYYIRHGASNYIAQSREINGAVRQRIIAASSSRRL